MMHWLWLQRLLVIYYVVLVKWVARGFIIRESLLPRFSNVSLSNVSVHGRTFPEFGLPEFADIALPSSVSFWAAPAAARGVDIPPVSVKSTKDSMNKSTKDRVKAEVVEIITEEGKRMDPRTHVLLTSYLSALFCVTNVITFLYWSRGKGVIVRILVYLFSLSTIKIAVRDLFTEHHFNFPNLVTAAHLLTSALFGFAILVYRRVRHGEPIVVPTLEELMFRIVPIAAAFGLSLQTNNSALVFCSAAFTEVIGATTPFATVLLILLLGMPFNWRLLGPTVVVVAGCCVSVWGEMHFSALGLALSFISVLGRAVKATLQANVLTGETKARFDPAALLAWTCLASFFLLAVISASTDGIEPFRRFGTLANPMKFWSVFLVSCLNASILNLAALFVTKELGAIGVQLVAQVKSVLTVLTGAVVLAESFSFSESIGFGCVLCGAYWFARTEQKLKADREQMQKPKADEEERRPLVSDGPTTKPVSV